MSGCSHGYGHFIQHSLAQIAYQAQIQGGSACREQHRPHARLPVAEPHRVHEHRRARENAEQYVCRGIGSKAAAEKAQHVIQYSQTQSPGKRRGKRHRLLRSIRVHQPNSLDQKLPPGADCS